jgi:hypothetical protein
LAWKDILISWSWLAVFFFAAILAYSISQPRPQPPQIVMAPIPSFPATAQQPPSWPPALTKTEIDNWSIALKPYHQKVTSVLIGFVDVRELEFVTSLTQTISNASWPVPSLSANNLIVGMRIVASNDVFEAAQQLQQLMEPKTGTIRLDKNLGKDKTGKPFTGFIIVYVGLKPQ